MNLTLIMAIVVLGISATNFIHWLGRKDGRLFYTPGPGWFRVGLSAITIGASICAVLFLADVIPGLTFLVVGFGLCVVQGLYSMWRRFLQQGARGSSR